MRSDQYSNNDYVRTYNAHPTTARMHRSDKRVRAIIGPYGSGKSVACAMEVFLRAVRQAPNAHKIRRTRFVVVRNTYSQLDDTTLRTFLEWFPEGKFGRYRKSDRVYEMRVPLADGTKVECDVLFRALERPDDVRKLLSLEVTGAWVNEFREIESRILRDLLSRCGRFPPLNEEGATWSGMWMDSNPFDIDSGYYKMFVEVDPEDDMAGLVDFFQQPSGLSEHAENLEFLPDRYYDDQLAMARAEGLDENWVNVHIHGKFGFTVDGRPVYGTDFNSAIHVAQQPLKAIRGVPIGFGQDFGLTPATVFAQIEPATGRWLILGELIGDDVGAQEFSRALVEEAQRRWPGFELFGFGDPAGEQRSQVDTRSSFDMFRAAGLKIQPAQFQAPTIRINSVRAVLRRLINGRPAMVIDPSCTKLVRGFMGGYQYRRIKVSFDKYDDKPDKNDFSHVHDALQYIVSHFEGPVLQGRRRLAWPVEADGGRRTGPVIMQGFVV